MPRGDGTGPNSAGAMTGRGVGYCTGNDVAGYEIPGRGFGLGCGHGRGFRRQAFGAYGYAPYQAAEAPDEKAILQNQAELLRKRLAALDKRLAALDEKD